MKSEEYFIMRDSVLRDVEAVCNVMDNESKDNIDKITIDIMFELNKWRKRNNLPLLSTIPTKQLIKDPESKIIICEICGKDDWQLVGDEKGKIKQIKCKNDLNQIINNNIPNENSGSQ